ncbi:MAG: hypothetical protein HYV35_03370 [Lentisphaerae bacterium]|nr:hypothetical protein [Lentisphaerota bacterium]
MNIRLTTILATVLLGALLITESRAAPGDLDTTFGGRALTVAIGSSTDVCYEVVRQADGKYVLAGYSWNGANDDFALARFDTNGNLDTTFGTNANGKVTTPIGSGTDISRAVAIQADGMIVVAGYAWGTGYDFALARYTTTGTLDTAFGTNGTGIMTTDINGTNGPEYAIAVAIQTDGMIVAAGYSWTTGKWDFALARYDTNGVLDTNFGTNANGKITTGLDQYANVAYDIAFQTDGKIVVSGYGGNPSAGNYQDFALARYTTTGTLDTTFSGDGKAVVNITGSRDYGSKMAIQADGKIVMVGGYYNNNDFLIARFTTAGALDTSFSGNGWDLPVASDGGNNTGYTLDVAVQDDQKIVVVGATVGSITPVNLDFTILRYATNGVLDTSFGAAGKVVTPIGYATDYALSVLAQPDGKIVVAGYANVTNNYYDFALARYHSDGRLDFKDGKTYTDIQASTDQIRGLAIQADGKIVGAGGGYDGSYYDFAVARYTTNGDLDCSFGYTNSGRRYTTINSGTELAYAALVQPDGKTVAGGYTIYYPSTPDSNRFALLRYTTNGGMDGSWGSGGIVQTSFTNSQLAYCLSIAQQPDGKIVAAGYATSATVYDFALARYNTNGTLDTSFGPNGDGMLTTSFGSGFDYATAVALQADGKIVVAGNTLVSVANSNDFALARYLTNGTLDTSFGTNGTGLMVTPIGTNNDVANAMAIQSDDKIVVAGYSWQGANSNDFAMARYNADGTLDTGFGTNGTGKVVTPVLSSNDICTSVALATRAASRWPEESVIIAAGYAWNNTNNDFAVVRYRNNGTLDTRFGNGGKITTDFSNGADLLYSVAIQSDGKIVAGGYCTVVPSDIRYGLARYDNEIASPRGMLLIIP